MSGERNEIACQTGSNAGILRWTSRAMILAGVGLLAAAAWFEFSAPEPEPEGPWLVVTPQTLEIGAMHQGNSRPVKFELTNRNPHRPVIVFGATEMCGPLGCADSSNVPVTVPPGGKATLQVIFRAGSDPMFEYDLWIYTDAPGQTEVPLKIVGETLPYSGPEHF